MTPALSLYLLAAAQAEPLMARRARSWLDRGTAVSRPQGEVVWIDLASGQPPDSAAALASRIADERPGTSFVVTSDDPVQRGDDLPWLARPVDFPKAVDAFLTAWSPSAGVWIGGPIWPVLVARARQAGVPMLLANATDGLAGVHRGIPARDLLGLFQGIVACGDDDGRALARALRRPITAIGRLQRSARPLDHDERERQRLTAALQARPVWYAARARSSEIEALRQAQTAGQSASHRLLMIVQPADAEALALLLDRYRARRSTLGAPPAGATVFIADLPGEEGLWYRLASVSFIGGTLGGPQAMADPFAAAALGSAILHGPHVAPYEGHFRDLAAARATRLVRDPDRLGAAVGDLLAPDRAALFAQQAWEVVSEGAEATDHVADEACRLLDGSS